MKDINNVLTVPAMPAAKKLIRRPTLIFKMPVEEQEEEQAKSKRAAGRYSIIVPRTNNDEQTR